MQQLVKRFLDDGLSRRGMLQKLTALGFGMAQAQSLLEAFQDSENAGKGLPAPGSTSMKGTGGELLMAQAKAAGAEYLFSNPGSFEVGLYDAQETSGVPLIMGLHEGIVELVFGLGPADLQRAVAAAPLIGAVGEGLHLAKVWQHVGEVPVVEAV